MHFPSLFEPTEVVTRRYSSQVADRLLPEGGFKFRGGGPVPEIGAFGPVQIRKAV